MPISKSAKKALRVSERKASLNRYRKALIKEALKNVSKDGAAKAVSMIDKGAKWGLFHKNKASRMKSSLSKKIGGPFSAKAKVDQSTVKPAPKSKPVAKKTTPKVTAKTKKTPAKSKK